MQTSNRRKLTNAFVREVKPTGRRARYWDTVAPAPTNLPERRPAGFLSLQTWRPEKRVHDLLFAIPHMRASTQKLLAGDGVERRYMTSETKCKPQYMTAAGESIWTVAQAHGMEWLGWITEQRRDALLCRLPALVDPSWSPQHRAAGGHFNRTVLEAMRCGAIPMGHVRAMGDEILQPHVHYVPLPAPTDSPAYAEAVDAACRMPPRQRATYRHAARDVLRPFARDYVAAQYLALARGQPAGWYDTLPVGSTPPAVAAKATRMLRQAQMATGSWF